MKTRKSKRIKVSFGKKIPTPKKHTTEKVRLRYEDIKSTPKKFKMIHYIFIGIAFIGIGSVSIVNVANWRNHKTSDEYNVKIK